MVAELLAHLSISKIMIFLKSHLASLSLLNGSFNTWRHTLRGGSGLIKNKFLIEAQLSKISSDGYIDRAASDLWSYHMKAALLLKKTKATS
jgi:hypothetical protein